LRQILRKIVESYEVTAREFEQLTENCQFQRYVALIDSKIRFDERPSPPHGAIIGQMTKLLVTQLDGPNGVEILSMVNDDGILSHIGKFLIVVTDLRLNNRSIQCPDASFKFGVPKSLNNVQLG